MLNAPANVSAIVHSTTARVQSNEYSTLKRTSRRAHAALHEATPETAATWPVSVIMPGTMCARSGSAAATPSQSTHNANSTSCNLLRLPSAGSSVFARVRRAAAHPSRIGAAVCTAVASTEASQAVK